MADQFVVYHRKLFRLHSAMLKRHGVVHLSLMVHSLNLVDLRHLKLLVRDQKRRWHLLVPRDG